MSEDRFPPDHPDVAEDIDLVEPPQPTFETTLLHGERPLALTVGAVVRHEERARVFDLREEVYRERSPYLLHARPGLHPAQDEFDGTAFHFAARSGGALAAACRFAPRVAGRWEADDLCDVPAGLLAAPERLLQISRVVVRRDLRGAGVTEVLLRDACRWLLARTGFDAYFALCVPKLAAFYLHFGAQPLDAPEVRVAERANNVYRFVHGTLAGSVDAIDAYLALRSADLVPQERELRKAVVSDAR